MACELHPAHTEARAELLRLTTRDLITVATGQGAVHERALALWYALGTDRDRSSLVPRRGDPRVVFEQLCEAGWPHTIVEVAREGLSSPPATLRSAPPIRVRPRPRYRGSEPCSRASCGLGEVARHQVLGPSVDQRWFRSADGMGSVSGRIKTNFFNPRIHDLRVLSGA
jgi:hypothetical protein